VIGWLKTRTAPICRDRYHGLYIRTAISTQKLCVLYPSKFTTELGGNARRYQLLAIPSEARAAESHGIAKGCSSS
jgi:hypothetical protein